MMNAANLSLTDRLFKEGFKTATLLDGLVLITRIGERKTRFEHWIGKIVRFLYHLKEPEGKQGYCV